MDARPSVERVCQLFALDERGLLTRRVRTKGAKGGVGAVVGGKNCAGYLQTQVDGHQTYVHRLAFVIANGRWPVGVVDHINGNRTDNRGENLRDVSLDVNKQNKRVALPNNKLGVLGVSVQKRTGKFRAQIHFGGRNHSLGDFADPETAHAAYVAAKRRHHEGCTL